MTETNINVTDAIRGQQEQLKRLIAQQNWLREAPETTAAVCLWCEYFWPHSRAAVRQIGLTDHHAEARRILRWIRASHRDVISREDVRRDALNQRFTADEVDRLLQVLATAGWLQKIPREPRPGPGRPTIRWAVNPKLI